MTGGAVANLRRIPARERFFGLRQLWTYNRATYAAGTAAAIAIAASTVLLPLPSLARVASLAGAAAIVAGMAGSLVVAHIVYDRSDLHRWGWLAVRVPAARACAVIHAGIDDASAALRALYPDATHVSLDIYDAATMSEPGIRVARRVDGTPASIRARSEALPVGDRSVDLAVLLFSAHELRNRGGRVALMREAARALAPGGRAVVVEHLRDVPNLLAFGPGCLHFYARRNWLGVFSEAGLRLVEELRITPFVRAFFLETA